MNSVIEGDETNREGHAAKVYFNACYGKDFSRDSDIPINKYLNYGYSIVLSAINREVKAFGYLTELGIHHIGQENPFNLSCDLMEPLRPYVDSLVVSGVVDDNNFKERLVNMLNDEVRFDGNTTRLDNAIHNYVQSALLALRTETLDKLKFPEYEFV